MSDTPPHKPVPKKPAAKKARGGDAKSSQTRRAGDGKTAEQDFPDRLLELLPNLVLFNGIAQKELPKILKDFEWVKVPGGTTLMRRGDEGQNLYIITAGSIGMWLERIPGEEQLVAQFVPGQTVGELAILSGEKRVGTLITLRDTELLRMPAEAFHKLAKRYPVIMENLSKLLVRRLHELMRGERHIKEWRSVPKTIAVLPLGEAAMQHETGDQLGLAFSAGGARVRLLDHQCKEQHSEWFYGIEAHHEHVIYVADRAHDAWTQLCLRQADRVLMVARAGATPPAEYPFEDLMKGKHRCVMELALLHEADADIGKGAVAWMEKLKPDHLHNIRLGNQDDMGRLARHLTGRATGLVLAGGGARGFAHIGVIRALRETGIKLDHIGGTSMGAIVAAGIALGWDDQELKQRMHDSFVLSNPLGRLTFPKISLFTGSRIQNLLENNFGEVSIEELWLPFFCVSSNLTSGREIVQRCGSLWQALRASVAIPGVVPPVVKDREVLVDGAIINNFPADTMAEMRRGPVIGVDVETHRAFSGKSQVSEDSPDWGIMGETVRGGPNIISVLMRAGTVNSEAQTKSSREHADLLFEPPVADVAIRDWQEFERVVEAGYEDAMRKLEETDLSLFGV